MARRAKSKSQKRNWRWYASMGLNGLVALSMVLGTVFLFTGAPRSAPPPTLAVPTVIATYTPMPQAPTSATAVPAAPLPTPTP